MRTNANLVWSSLERGGVVVPGGFVTNKAMQMIWFIIFIKPLLYPLLISSAGKNKLPAFKNQTPYKRMPFLSGKWRNIGHSLFLKDNWCPQQVGSRRRDKVLLQVVDGWAGRRMWDVWQRARGISTKDDPQVWRGGGGVVTARGLYPIVKKIKHTS